MSAANNTSARAALCCTVETNICCQPAMCSSGLMVHTAATPIKGHGIMVPSCIIISEDNPPPMLIMTKIAPRMLETAPYLRNPCIGPSIRLFSDFSTSGLPRLFQDSRGTVNVKVEPDPRVLATVSVPPSACASVRQIYNPNPSPSVRFLSRAKRA